MAGLLRRIWGGNHVAIERGVRGLWVDAILVIGICGLAYALYIEADMVKAPKHDVAPIYLSPWNLPWYTFLSLSRGLAAYVISLIFTLGYGYWAAKDQRAERVLVPLLDILQSIPVLAFMPGLVLALVGIFPYNNIGLELAAVLMIFTGQAWNMTFSLYRSLRSVPRELSESATIFRFSLWQRVRGVELPFATMGLVWNSMMSMAGGWFFLSVSEAFTLGEGHDFRLQGLGSYMNQASKVKDHWAMFYGIVAMILMIVVLDQLLWRPLVAWAQKFRVEDGSTGEVTRSWFLNMLRRSRSVAWCRDRYQQYHSRSCSPRTPGRPGWMRRAWGRIARPSVDKPVAEPGPVLPPPVARKVHWLLSLLPLIILLGGMLWGAEKMTKLILQVPGHDWGLIFAGTGLTMVRVILAIVLGTLWTVPAGLAIGLSPRLSRMLQPVIQIAASFPAPMLFPLVIGLLAMCGVTLGFSSIVLMLLGTQWYILFNVIAGAMAIPADLREAAETYGVRGFRRFKQLYLPAILPYLVTGWVTASGGAWNASIVSEYYAVDDKTVKTTLGLGSLIGDAAQTHKYALLAASVVVMSTVVVGINRLLWHRLYHLAETKYSISK